MNCWKGRKGEQILFAFTPEDTEKTVSAAAQQVTGLVHTAELPGIWKKNLHAIRKARTRHMCKCDESRGLPWQWRKPTEISRMTMDRGSLHPGFALYAARARGNSKVTFHEVMIYPTADEYVLLRMTSS